MMKRPTDAHPSPPAAAPSRPDGEWRTPAAEDLFQTVAALRSAEDAAAFLRDLCTMAELQALSARWQVAQLLDAGVHYQEIARRTGASTATISRVNTWLRFGAGGYRSLLDRRTGAGA